MSDNSEKTLLYPEEKIKNYPLYLYRIFGKLLSLAVFGVGTILLSIICFPIGKLLFHPKKNFRYKMRHLVYMLFNVFICFMRCIGVVTIKVNKKNYLNKLRSVIVVANHPAYLDSPVMISQLSHTSLIAKASLSKKNIMHAVINELYMPNSLPFDEMLARAREDLERGNTVMLFPEGTRSTPYGQNLYKKGAARISLATGCPIIPVYIGGTSKKGLGKGDKVFEFNPTKRYIFDLQVKEPVCPSEFEGLPEAIAAKRMTRKIRDVLSDEANSQWRY
ncbi:MAG: 1-acyl-sn-glycerol-3-phosphate acyltransferase [Treponema sp.]|nr:1-acyl-sn-glycerol-3-phosphate acyltransferase [Treponema sp.]